MQSDVVTNDATTTTATADAAGAPPTATTNATATATAIVTPLIIVRFSHRTCTPCGSTPSPVCLSNLQLQAAAAEVDRRVSAGLQPGLATMPSWAEGLPGGELRNRKGSGPSMLHDRPKGDVVFKVAEAVVKFKKPLKRSTDV